MNKTCDIIGVFDQNREGTKAGPPHLDPFLDPHLDPLLDPFKTSQNIK